MWLANPSGINSWILEGDDFIAADNQTLPGTGLEDAYNGGYYYNWVGVQNNEPEGGKPAFAVRPYHGLLQMNPKLNSSQNFVGVYRVDQYRWLIPDYIPFRQSIRVDVETYYANVEIGSTAFYYLLVASPPSLADLTSLLAAMDSGPPDTTWNAAADLDASGAVDSTDLSILLFALDP